MDGSGRNNSFIACTYHLGLAKRYTIALGILIAYAIIANVLLVRNQFNLSSLFTINGLITWIYFSLQNLLNIKTFFKLQIYMLHKVSLHPVAKVFSLWERIFGLLQCTFAEIPKLVFYRTSCQLNWSLMVDNVKKMSVPINTQPSIGLAIFSIFTLSFIKLCNYKLR